MGKLNFNAAALKATEENCYTHILELQLFYELISLVGKLINNKGTSMDKECSHSFAKLHLESINLQQQTKAVILGNAEDAALLTLVSQHQDFRKRAEQEINTRGYILAHTVDFKLPKL